MKILFISHSYPPIKGGVESQNYNLAQGLSKIATVKIIANGRGKIWLPIFLPLTFIRAFFIMTTYDVCLVGNGVLAPIAATLKFFHPRKKFFSVVHGLDITYIYKPGLLPKIYKSINIPSLKKLDKIFMVGRPTVEEAVKAGIPEKQCRVIHNGVPVTEFRENHTKEELARLLELDIKGKKVVLRLARFVPHKGTDWFIRNIMPRLPENVCLVATGYRVSKNNAGDPDNFTACERAIKECQLENKVKLLPNLDQKDLLVLLNTCDLYVSPNIKYPGSMEGFGINVIEAGACERVVVASDLEGLAEAIQNGKNGFLVDPENVDQWTKKIMAILNAGPEFIENFGKLAGQYVEENYSWEKICEKYLEEMKYETRSTKHETNSNY